MLTSAVAFYPKSKQKQTVPVEMKQIGVEVYCNRRKINVFTTIKGSKEQLVLSTVTITGNRNEGLELKWSIRHWVYRQNTKLTSEENVTVRQHEAPVTRWVYNIALLLFFLCFNSAWGAGVCSAFSPLTALFFLPESGCSSQFTYLWKRHSRQLRRESQQWNIDDNSLWM